MQVCKFLSIRLCNNVSMPLYEYVIISYRHTRVQLGIFSSAWNLAILQVGPQSCMIIYLDMISPWTSDYKQLLLRPKGLLKVGKQYPSEVWRMTDRSLKDIWNILTHSDEVLLELIIIVELWSGLIIGVKSIQPPTQPPTTPPNLKFLKMTLNQGKGIRIPQGYVEGVWCVSWGYL